MTIIHIRGELEAPRDSGSGDKPLPSCRAAAVPDSRPAPDWIEAARQEFCRRWWDENGDSFEFCSEAYGDSHV